MPRSRSNLTPGKLQPFSLILKPEEMNALRKIARRERTSVGGVVRRAIYVVIERIHPERRKLVVEQLAEEFLSSLSQRYPSSFLTPAKRSRFKRQAVRLLS